MIVCLCLLKLYYNVTDKQTDRRTVRTIAVGLLNRVDARSKDKWANKNCWILRNVVAYSAQLKISLLYQQAEAKTW